MANPHHGPDHPWRLRARDQIARFKAAGRHKLARTTRRSVAAHVNDRGMSAWTCPSCGDPLCTGSACVGGAY